MLDAHPHDTFESEIEGHYIVNGMPAIGTSEGLLVLDQVQPEGKRGMPGSAFLNGQPGCFHNIPPIIDLYTLSFCH